MTHAGMNLSDRMKMYESLSTSQRLMPRLPVCCRIDGRAFHTFCRGMDKPFDEGMVQVMAATTRSLVSEFQPVIAHTFSDEISLIFYQANPESELPFGGKIFKLQSVLASAATAAFNHFWGLHAAGAKEHRAKRCPQFDCRVWQVPTLEEAVNYLIWREQDAARNSISAVAQAHFSHSQLHQKNAGQMQDMLMSEKEINWNDLPDHLKRGSYFTRVIILMQLSGLEWSLIPERHRPAADQFVKKTAVQGLYLPRLTAIINRVGVIFDGEEPKTEKEE